VKVLLTIRTQPLVKFTKPPAHTNISMFNCRKVLAQPNIVLPLYTTCMLNPAAKTPIIAHALKARNEALLVSDKRVIEQLFVG
jgi:hypothetical protein